MERNLLFFAVLVCGMFTLNSCKSIENTPTENNEVIYTLLQHGNMFGDGTEGFSEGGFVISSESDLEAFRTKANSVNNVVEALSIDFETHELLVYIDKIRGTNGHELRLATVYETGSQITAHIVHSESTEMAGEVISQPFIIVSILKSDKEVRFSITE